MNRLTAARFAVAGSLTFVATACGNHPAAPSPSTPPPTTVTISGWVWDAALRYLPGATVQIADGPLAALATVTDDAGRFVLTGPFGGSSVNLRATKDGFAAATTKQYIPTVGGCCFTFTLYSLVPNVNIAGDYTLTFIADSACADFPNEARTRTYTATITPASPPYAVNSPYFQVTLGGASFPPPMWAGGNSFGIRVVGDDLAFQLDGELSFITEQLAPLTYLTLTGSAGASLGDGPPATISMPFDGRFDYCVLKSELERSIDCTWIPDRTFRASCASKNHRVILRRR
jgi:hypothetical protein